MTMFPIPMSILGLVLECEFWVWNGFLPQTEALDLCASDEENNISFLKDSQYPCSACSHLAEAALSEQQMNNPNQFS